MCKSIKTFFKLLFWLAGVPGLAAIFLYVAAQWSFEIGQWRWGIYHILVLVGYEVITGLILKDKILECFGR
ncbi:MAG: hypothetical protein ACOCUU_02425 [Nanoarchaeota archaeon]